MNNLSSFMNIFNSENLIKTPACFKSKNPFCINLILTHKKESFKKLCTVEVGVSGHHHLVATILKSKLIKDKPTTKLYLDCKKFDLNNSKLSCIQTLTKKM